MRLCKLSSRPANGCELITGTFGFADDDVGGIFGDFVSGAVFLLPNGTSRFRILETSPCQTDE